MNVSQVIVKILEREGITDAFGIPGAGINGLYKYMAESKIRHYTHRHEECCVHAAGGYFRASGRMAVALCTSGPGATNFVTGIYTCNIDSRPRCFPVRRHRQNRRSCCQTHLADYRTGKGSGNHAGSIPDRTFRQARSRTY